MSPAGRPEAPWRWFRDPPPRGLHLLGKEERHVRLDLDEEQGRPTAARTARPHREEGPAGTQAGLPFTQQKSTGKYTELGEGRPDWAPGPLHNAGTSRRAQDRSAGVWTRGARQRVGRASRIRIARTKVSQGLPSTSCFLIHGQSQKPDGSKHVTMGRTTSPAEEPGASSEGGASAQSLRVSALGSGPRGAEAPGVG